MLNFIGNGSAFNVERGNNSAYYVKDNRMLLIDCGSDVFGRLQGSDRLEGVDNIDIIITHTHADHVGSLADLIFYMFYHPSGEFIPRVTVHHSKDVQVQELLTLNGVQRVEQGEGHYHLHTVNDLEKFPVMDEELRMYFKDTPHVPALKSKSVVITTEDEGTILYTGDTCELSKESILLHSLGFIDKMYVDTCSLDYEGNNHLSLQKLTNLISPENRSRVWCMHLDTGFNVELAQSLGFNVTHTIFDV